MWRASPNGPATQILPLTRLSGAECRVVCSYDRGEAKHRLEGGGFSCLKSVIWIWTSIFARCKNPKFLRFSIWGGCWFLVAVDSIGSFFSGIFDDSSIWIILFQYGFNRNFWGMGLMIVMRLSVPIIATKRHRPIRTSRTWWAPWGVCFQWSTVKIWMQNLRAPGGWNWEREMKAHRQEGKVFKIRKNTLMPKLASYSCNMRRPQHSHTFFWRRVHSPV